MDATTVAAAAAAAAAAASDLEYDEGPCDLANKTPFTSLCSMLSKIMNRKKMKKKLEALDLEGLRKQTMSADGPQTLYPIFRLLMPAIDRGRATYNIQITKMVDLYVKSLGIDDPNNKWANTLRGWKDPHKLDHSISTATGDFPQVLRDVLVSRGKGKSTEKMMSLTHKSLTVGQINDELDKLTLATDKSEKLAVIGYLLQHCDADEHYWLARIIVKDLKVGLSHAPILKAFHQDAFAVYDNTLDLRLVCSQLRDPNIRMALSINLFSTFTPMLLKKVDNSASVTSSMKKDFVIEDKLDGERLVVHIDKDRMGGLSALEMYTRNGNDYTRKYGPAIGTKILDAVKCRRCILDGEILAFDNTTKTYLPFGSNRTVGNRAMNHLAELSAGGGGGASNLQFVGDALNDHDQWLVYVVFDLLYLDGVDAGVHAGQYTGCLTGLEYHKRRALLTQVLTPLQHWVEILEQQLVSCASTTPKQRIELLTARLDEILENRGEGLVIKDITAPYVVGAREPTAVKLKPNRKDNISEPMDLIILGGYYGTGRRRSGGVSHFLLGVVKETTKDSDRPMYATFCKVGTGYNDNVLEQIRDKLGAHWVRTSVQKPPHYADWRPKDLEDKPDFWVAPEHSILLEITGAQITPSFAFSVNFTVRFPRVLHPRFDKPWKECMSDLELAEFIRSEGGNMHGKSNGADAVTNVRPAKNGKRKGRGVAKEGVMPQYKTYVADPDSLIVAAGSVFKGFTAHVIPGTMLMEDEEDEGEDVDMESDEDEDEDGLAHFGGWSNDTEHADAETKRLRVKNKKKKNKKRRTRASDRLEVKTPGKTYRVKDKRSMEELIVSFGGEVVGECSETTDYVIALGPTGLKYANLVKHGTHDVLTPRFVLESIRREAVVNPPEYKHYYSMTNETRNRLEGELDKYGDHYTCPANKRTFAMVLKAVENYQNTKNTEMFARQPTKKDWSMLLDDEDDPLLTKLTLFRGARIFFDRFKRLPGTSAGGCTRSDSSDSSGNGDNDGAQELVDECGEIEVSMRLFKLYLGTVEDIICKDCTYVVMAREDMTRAKEIKAALRGVRDVTVRQANSRVVSQEWIQHVIDSEEAWDKVGVPPEFEILL